LEPADLERSTGAISIVVKGLLYGRDGPRDGPSSPQGLLYIEDEVYHRGKARKASLLR
jgi:hypothetical protein